MYKTYSDLIQYTEFYKLSSNTKILVPYRESYYSIGKLLTLAIRYNSFICTDSTNDSEVDERILTVGDIVRCVKTGSYYNNLRHSHKHEKFYENNRIQFSSYINNISSTGARYVKGFVVEDNMLLLDATV